MTRRIPPKNGAKKKPWDAEKGVILTKRRREILFAGRPPGNAERKGKRSLEKTRDAERLRASFRKDAKNRKRHSDVTKKAAMRALHDLGELSFHMDTEWMESVFLRWTYESGMTPIERLLENVTAHLAMSRVSYEDPRGELFIERLVGSLNRGLKDFRRKGHGREVVFQSSGSY